MNLLSFSFAIILILGSLSVGECDDGGIRALFVVDVTSSETSPWHVRLARSAQFAGTPVQTNLVRQMEDEGTCSKDACSDDSSNTNTLQLVREKLQVLLAESADSVAMVTDSVHNDVIIGAPAESILSRFELLGGDIVFASSSACSLDEDLCSRFPSVIEGARFLSSGVIVGRVSSLLKLLDRFNGMSADNYQMFFVHIYLDKEVRDDLKLVIDHRSQLLQNIDGVATEVDLRYKGKESFIQNIAYSTDPSIVFGGLASRIYINSLGNFLADAWNPVDGCKHCWIDQIELGADPTKFPHILLAVFIESKTPFFDEFLQRLSDIIYPKKKIHLFIHNSVKYHHDDMQAFKDRFDGVYSSITFLSKEEKIAEAAARTQAVDLAISKGVDFFFSVDSTVQIDNPYMLKLLIEQNVDIIAPLLVRPYSKYSNFWGSISDEGDYEESSDYQEIIEGKVRGLWNVPLISSCYLIKEHVLKNPDTKPNFSLKGMSTSVSFATAMRQTDIIMYVTNRASMGHLVSTDRFVTDRPHAELWQLEQNRWDWERRYIHSNYSTALSTETVNEQPCQDVFWFPLLTERFCEELIDIMENFGQWSSGSHDDSRIEGGYESVPTRDIHMKQVDLELQWLEVLRDYVRPLQEKVYQGYLSDPLTAQLNFVVRYRADEQPALRPHHDSSTYTINVALNSPGVDYTGGGCRFLRYNCSVTDSRRGWMLMHPGRLTHYHEGLPTISGTRYILISFVDP